METLALVWGVCAFLGFGLALIPCLGWLNWANIPFAFVGVVVSAVAMARSSKERGSGPAIAGLVLNCIAAVVGLFRLALGGGVI